MVDQVKHDSAGFRLRGGQMTRIETFTDAAFAFALTLLVVSLVPPTTFGQLGLALRAVPAFFLSALVLSCALVFTVLVYVYPLRFMFALMMTWIAGMTGLPFDTGVTITEIEDVNRIFATRSSATKPTPPSARGRSS